MQEEDLQSEVLQPEMQDPPDLLSENKCGQEDGLIYLRRLKAHKLTRRYVLLQVKFLICPFSFTPCIFLIVYRSIWVNSMVHFF